MTTPYRRRDYYWKRNGWRFEVCREVAGTHFSTGLRFWREGTAARVANEIFAAYHEGREAEREARPASQRQERR